MLAFGSPSKFFFWVILNWVVTSESFCPPPNQHGDENFKQKASRFWEFEQQTNSWVEISLPFDLMSCLNGKCAKVASIDSAKEQSSHYIPQQQENGKLLEENQDEVLPLRRRISLTRMSEASIWVTGQSGSIYERFWNGVKWVIAPHELPISAGQAVSVFIVNRTILALSEAGTLYQLHLDENSQPMWKEFSLTSEPSRHTAKTEPSDHTATTGPNTVKIKSGIASHDRVMLYFSTMNGSLVEVDAIQPESLRTNLPYPTW